MDMQQGLSNPSSDWETLLVEFLSAELEHDFAALEAEGARCCLRNARLTVEVVRHFESGISDLEVRQRFRRRADELEKRLAA